MSEPICSELFVTANTHYGQKGQNVFFRLTLERPAWAAWRPGQFVMLRAQSWGNDMIWARPVSISRLTSHNLELFIQSAGRGTRLMAAFMPGEKVTIWGPLGTGFAQTVGSSTLLLAGGMGLAPFLGYAETHPEPFNLSMLFGHRLSLDNYPVDDLEISFTAWQEQSEQELLAFQAEICRALDLSKKQNGLVLACGPFPFLHYIWQQVLRRGIRAQLSLEQKMACGIGACLGCVTVSSKNWPNKKTAGLPVQTCTKGPVFWADEIDLDARPDPGV